MPVAASRSSPNGTGFLLTDLEFIALYANDAAGSILFFPEKLSSDAEFGVRAQARIRSIFDADHFIGVGCRACGRSERTTNDPKASRHLLHCAELTQSVESAVCCWDDARDESTVPTSTSAPAPV